MNMAMIKRRVGALEFDRAFSSLDKGAALLPGEIESIAARVERGDRLFRTDVARLERSSPVIQGELLITAHRGNVIVKRYRGIDLVLDL